jgi:hypothetical protein
MGGLEDADVWGEQEDVSFITNYSLHAIFFAS